MSLRRRIYTLVGVTLLVAAIAIFAVSQAVFAKDGGWTEGVLYFMFLLIGLVLALGLSLYLILDHALFRRLAYLTSQVQPGAAHDATRISVGRDGRAVAARREDQRRASPSWKAPARSRNSRRRASLKRSRSCRSVTPTSRERTSASSNSKRSALPWAAASRSATPSGAWKKSR